MPGGGWGRMGWDWNWEMDNGAPLFCLGVFGGGVIFLGACMGSDGGVLCWGVVSWGVRTMRLLRFSGCFV
ncbi:hypothetical protein BO99DRAFT_182610 [Aspergillus violaceofuscus CBS 115571]|uniref:Transmembrane protein n=1 Tax=Aspergillus violaceofuscus (strain CBS 115571) TaxID=1450538 RepID=A0A2V5HPV2_ASPV1|nr:hypothetical protein BO99DRAFT_182610 [Aspergillus violaceofuscus CBS 115571]